MRDTGSFEQALVFPGLDIAMHNEERENTSRKLENRTNREFRNTNDRFHQFQIFPVPYLFSFMHSSIIFFPFYKLEHSLQRRNASKDLPIIGSHMVKYTEVSETMIIEIKCFYYSYFMLCERSLVFQN